MRELTTMAATLVMTVAAALGLAPEPEQRIDPVTLRASAAGAVAYAGLLQPVVLDGEAAGEKGMSPEELAELAKRSPECRCLKCTCEKCVCGTVPEVTPAVKKTVTRKVCDENGCRLVEVPAAEPAPPPKVAPPVSYRLEARRSWVATSKRRGYWRTYYVRVPVTQKATRSVLTPTPSRTYSSGNCYGGSCYGGSCR